MNLKKLWRHAHRLGAAGSYVGDVAIFGTRYTPRVSAGDAIGRTPPVGVGPHSVWQGPRRILGGAPVLRRNQTA